MQLRPQITPENSVLHNSIFTNNFYTKFHNMSFLSLLAKSCSFLCCKDRLSFSRHHFLFLLSIEKLCMYLVLLFVVWKVCFKMFLVFQFLRFAFESTDDSYSFRMYSKVGIFDVKNLEADFQFLFLLLQESGHQSIFFAF